MRERERISKAMTAGTSQHRKEQRQPYESHVFDSSKLNATNRTSECDKNFDEKRNAQNKQEKATPRGNRPYFVWCKVIVVIVVAVVQYISEMKTKYTRNAYS